MTDLSSLPIFQPLSDATRHALETLPTLGPHDYLEVHQDEETEDFLLKADTWRPVDTATNRAHDGTPVERCSKWLEAHVSKWYSAFPEREWTRGVPAYLRVPVTDYTCLLIQACWPASRIIFMSLDAEVYYLHTLARFLSGNARAAMQARFKRNREVPSAPAGFREVAGLELADYQHVAVSFVAHQEQGCLYMDMGTGKTPITVAVVCAEAREAERMQRVLVVCPPEVRINWQREFARFASCPGKVCVLRGDAYRRLRLLTHAVREDLEVRFSACIVSYDTVSNDVEYLAAVPWDRIVTDEAHWFKGPETRRWAALARLRDSAARRLELTGTPIANTYRDLWTQLEFLGQGMSGFSSFEAFRTFHGKYEGLGDESGVEKLVGLKNVPLMQERLARVSFMITKEEAHLNLPEKTYDYHEVKMTPRQQKFYDAMVRQMVIELEEEAARDARRMTASHVLTKLMRLAQITSGFVAWDAEINPDTGDVLTAREIEQIDPGRNPKILAVERMMRERDPLCKTLIWACFREDVSCLTSHLEARGFIGGHYYGDTPERLRQEQVDRFNRDDDFTFLVLNPQSAGMGLNLVGYDVERPDASEMWCGHEIFASCNWSSVLRSQAEDRAHRRGTRRNVRITDLVIPDTIDPEIRQAVTDKQTMAMEIQDVSEILERVLDWRWNDGR